MPHRFRQGACRLHPKDAGGLREAPARVPRSRARLGHRNVRVLASLVSFALLALSSGYSSLAAAEPPSGPPAIGTLPAVKGTPADGKKMKVSKGGWGGLKPLSYSYAWQRCNASGTECAPIEGATSLTYIASSQDVGHTLRGVVTATNADGSASAASSPSAEIGASSPKKKQNPTVSGTARDGQPLSAADGLWKGTRPMTFTYQWQYCRSGPCTAITGATDASYRPATDQLGGKIRVLVTATNSSGSSTAASKKSAKILPGPPVNVTAPAVSGVPVVEQTLSAEPGAWAGTGPFAYTYQWRGCNPLGECENISGATGPSYTVGPLQLANSIEVAVTATSALGSSTAISAPSSLIGGLLPSNTGLPGITGLLQDGGLLSALTGSWSGSEPLSFSYLWEACDSAGANCEPISGALGSTLGLIAGEVGKTVRVAVTATNSAGSSTATSEPTSLINALLPSNNGLPSITGLLQDGSALSAVAGSWTGTGPLSYGYQWLLCNAAGGSCKEISGASGGSLALLTGMIGSTARLVVTATNSAGSTSATSEPTGLIKALLPSNISLPSIAGIAEDGGTLTGAKGSWSGSEPSFGYQWLLCNSSGGACKEVSGATGTTLGLLSGEIGSTARLLVTATNSAGSVSATSEPTSAILAILPANTAIPSIQGLLQTGQVLTGVVGKWSGSEPLTYSYQWQTCGLLGKENECKNLAEAIKSTLKLELLQVGLTLRLIVTATNARGAVSKASTITSAIGGLVLNPVEGSA